MDNIEITQNIIDYIINNRSRFEMDIPKLGEKWNVESITTYSGVNCGNPVVELSNDNKDWMVLPKELLYQQLENMLEESLSKETEESWNKRFEIKEFERILNKEWQDYINRGAATVDAFEDNTQELAFAKGFNSAWNYKKEEPINEDLEEAAKYCIPDESYHMTIESKEEGSGENVYDYVQMLDMFKAGAKWQKEQMMENSVECTVHVDAGGYPYIGIELYDYENNKPLAKVGDKVKVIINN